MAITIDDIKDFHLDSESSIVLLETIEITHSSWINPIRVVTNHSDGLNATLENDTLAFFEFAPLIIKRGNSANDLDQSLDITLGDLGEIVPPLIQSIRDAGNDEQPEVIYRSYAFDVVSMTLTKPKPIDVVKGLKIRRMNRDHQATSFEAKTSEKNTVRTGKLYSLQDYPDLRGLL